MAQPDGQVGVTIRAPRDPRVIVQIVVRVVHARDSQLDLRWAGQGSRRGGVDGELDGGVRGVVPAAFDEGRAHPLPWQLHLGGLALLAQQVDEGVHGARREVVVAAENEHAGSFQQWPERAEYSRHAVLLAEVVARVDHQVRVQAVQRGDPFLLVLLLVQHVQVADVQQSEAIPIVGQRAGLKQRHCYLV